MNPGKLVNLGIFVHTLAQDRVSERERERERETKAMYIQRQLEPDRADMRDRIEDERQVLEKACFVN